MNKTNLVDVLADTLNLSDPAARKGVDALLAAIVKAVASGDTVTVQGFGTFEQSHRAAYTGRNPSTGEPIEVPETTVPKFRPGSAFKAEVNDVARVVAR
jgi:DNA-binding protein HU-beta